jgi:hypothetical protein
MQSSVSQHNFDDQPGPWRPGEDETLDEKVRKNNIFLNLVNALRSQLVLKMSMVEGVQEEIKQEDIEVGVGEGHLLIQEDQASARSHTISNQHPSPRRNNPS